MPDCGDCKVKYPDVPWQVHQATVARMSLANRRWFIAWIITFVILVGVVVFLFWQTSQYEQVTTEYTQEIDTGDGDFDAENIINRGGIYYGKSAANDEDKEIPQENRR